MYKIAKIFLLLIIMQGFIIIESALVRRRQDTMKIYSPMFENGQPIPQKFTCDGDNVSPRLDWEGIPAGTKSLVLICDDPDAPGGTFVHWVVFDIPPTVAGFIQGVDISTILRSKTGRE